MSNENVPIRTNAVKRKDEFDIDGLAEDFLVRLKRAADAAHELYKAAPSGPQGQYVSRLKSQLNVMLEDAAEKL